MLSFTKAEPSFDEHVTTVCCKAAQKTEPSFDEHVRTICCKATQMLN